MHVSSPLRVFSRRRVLWPILAATILVWGGLLGFRTTYHAYRVPTGSMIPNLLPGDFFYARTTGPDFRPRRGDVLVFVAPTESRALYIHRCVALAGDSVAVRDGILRVNDEIYESALDDPKADHSCIPSAGKSDGCPAPHTLLDQAARDRNRRGVEFGPEVVPADHVFMMGDNRYNARDSRYWGPVPLAAIRGRASFLYWSSSRDDGVRWNRLLRRVR